jgi:hypothetical protein
MKAESECVVTASLLRSSRVLANASNCAAVMAAVGLLLSHAEAARLLFATSILCWPMSVYLGVRVAIDASLFQNLAGELTDGGQALDKLLRDRGLMRARPERTLAERSRAAIKIWKRMIVIVTIQLAILAAAVVIQALAR